MPAERSQQIERLYHEARERDPRERAAFLVQACAGDNALGVLETGSLMSTAPVIYQLFLERRERIGIDCRRTRRAVSREVEPW